MDAKTLSAIAKALRAFPPVRLAYVYGSSLTRSDFRDVDVALGLARGRGAGRDPIGLRLRVATALQRRLPSEFDVHLLDEMPLSVQHRVIATGRCVLRRSEIERTRYESGVLREFLDFQPAHDWLVEQSLRRAARR